jgi:hypothetical protein
MSQRWIARSSFFPWIGSHGNWRGITDVAVHTHRPIHSGCGRHFWRYRIVSFGKISPPEGWWSATDHRKCRRPIFVCATSSEKRNWTWQQCRPRYSCHLRCSAWDRRSVAFWLEEKVWPLSSLDWLLCHHGWSEDQRSYESRSCWVRDLLRQHSSRQSSSSYCCWCCCWT